jgi:hypothetical protein
MLTIREQSLRYQQVNEHCGYSFPFKQTNKFMKHGALHVVYLPAVTFLFLSNGAGLLWPLQSHLRGSSLSPPYFRSLIEVLKYSSLLILELQYPPSGDIISPEGMPPCLHQQIFSKRHSRDGFWPRTLLHLREKGRQFGAGLHKSSYFATAPFENCFSSGFMPVSLTNRRLNFKKSRVQTGLLRLLK